MARGIVQIYEVQTPDEAEALVELGVDHIGSVLMTPDFKRRDALSKILSLVSGCGRKSTLIPLFLDTEVISRALDHYRPDIVHFCEMLTGNGSDVGREASFERQRVIRERFPEIRIMRSVPVGPTDQSDRVPTLEIAQMFEPVSDFFLTDTLVVGDEMSIETVQPVSGFVGITGKTCDWDMAAALVNASGIPVILAGGISPDNVTDGLVQVKPAGVDSCTLTNALDEDGKPIRFRKDLKKVARLVEKVRRSVNYEINETEEL